MKCNRFKIISLVLAAMWSAAVFSTLPMANVQTFHIHSAEVLNATFNSDGTKILTASKDGTAKVINSESGETLLTLKIPNLNTAFFSS